LAGGEEAKILPAVAAFGSAYALGTQGVYFIRPKDVDKGWRFCASLQGKFVNRHDIRRSILVHESRA
jgi:hypothetical protein